MVTIINIPSTPAMATHPTRQLQDRKAPRAVRRDLVERLRQTDEHPLGAMIVDETDVHLRDKME